MKPCGDYYAARREDPYDPEMPLRGLHENWRAVGTYLITHTLEEKGPMPFEVLQLFMYELTREVPVLQKVFPFYWYVDGPVSEPLMLLFDELIDKHIINGPRIYRWQSRFTGDESAC